MSLRAQTGLCSHFSWSSCPGVGVCGDSHTCLRVFLEVQRAHLLGLFLLVPGQAFPVPQLAWGGGWGGDGDGHFPPQLYQVGFQALPIPCPSNT